MNSRVQHFTSSRENEGKFGNCVVTNHVMSFWNHLGLHCVSVQNGLTAYSCRPHLRSFVVHLVYAVLHPLICSDIYLG